MTPNGNRCLSSFRDGVRNQLVCNGIKSYRRNNKLLHIRKICEEFRKDDHSLQSLI